MPWEQREVAPAHVPLGEGYEHSSLRGAEFAGDREIELRPMAGVYKGRDPKKCMAKDDTCEGFRAQGTEFCAGHLRSKAV